MTDNWLRRGGSSHIFARLLAGGLLLICWVGAEAQPKCHDKPWANSATDTNPLSVAVDDMTLPHQGYPHGVPASYDWAQGPVERSQAIPGRFHAVVAWGQVYEDRCGNPAHNTRVQIKDIRIYLLDRWGGTWRLLQHARRVAGAAYRESFSPPIHRPADIRSEPDGGISVKAGGGFNFHFYSPDRARIRPKHVAALLATVQARLIVDDPTRPDDRSHARYILSVGADLWRDTVIEYDRDENNPDMGMGRFRYVTPDWQSFNMLYMRGGIDPSRFLSNPPPLTLSHATPP
jgi:hypothetical protein